MSTQETFCCICNGRLFDDFRGRANAKCKVCGSLERHRSFVLALLSLQVTSKTHVAILQPDENAPRYTGYIENLVPLRIISESDLRRDDMEFDIIYHDHILKTTFLGFESYGPLIAHVNRMLKPGASQLVSPAPMEALRGLLSESGGLVASADGGSYSLELFDPVKNFGPDISKSCVLRKARNGVVSSNSIIMATRI